MIVITRIILITGGCFMALLVLASCVGLIHAPEPRSRWGHAPVTWKAVELSCFSQQSSLVTFNTGIVDLGQPGNYPQTAKSTLFGCWSDRTRPTRDAASSSKTYVCQFKIHGFVWKCEPPSLPYLLTVHEIVMLYQFMIFYQYLGILSSVTYHWPSSRFAACSLSWTRPSESSASLASTWQEPEKLIQSTGELQHSAEPPAWTPERDTFDTCLFWEQQNEMMGSTDASKTSWQKSLYNTIISALLSRNSVHCAGAAGF